MRLSSPTDSTIYCTPFETTRHPAMTEEYRARQPIAAASAAAASVPDYSRQSAMTRPEYFETYAPCGMASVSSSSPDLFYRQTPICPPPSTHSWNPSGSYYPPEPTFAPEPVPTAGPYHGVTAHYDSHAEYVPETAVLCKLPPVTHPYDAKLPQRRGATQLWEFLLDLLNESGNETVIAWIDEDALTFRVLDPDELARRWGALKSRPKMNYDKLSRSLRYYYQKKLLTKIASEKYVYKFLCHPSVLYASLGEDPSKAKTGSQRRSHKRHNSADVLEECAQATPTKVACVAGASVASSPHPHSHSHPHSHPMRIHARTSDQFAAYPFCTPTHIDIATEIDFAFNQPPTTTTSALWQAASPIANLPSPTSSSPSPSPSLPQSPQQSESGSVDSRLSATAQCLKSFLEDVIYSDSISLSASEDEIEDDFLRFDDGRNACASKSCSVDLSSSSALV